MSINQNQENPNSITSSSNTPQQHLVILFWEKQDNHYNNTLIFKCLDYLRGGTASPSQVPYVNVGFDAKYIYISTVIPDLEETNEMASNWDYMAAC